MERLCAYMSRRLIEKLIYEKKRLDRRTFPFRRDRFIILDPNCGFLREILPAVSHYRFFILDAAYLLLHYSLLYDETLLPKMLSVCFPRNAMNGHCLNICDSLSFRRVFIGTLRFVTLLSGLPRRSEPKRSRNVGTKRNVPITEARTVESPRTTNHGENLMSRTYNHCVISKRVGRAGGVERRL